MGAAVCSNAVQSGGPIFDYFIEQLGQCINNGLYPQLAMDAHLQVPKNLFIGQRGSSVKMFFHVY